MIPQLVCIANAYHFLILSGANTNYPWASDVEATNITQSNQHNTWWEHAQTTSLMLLGHETYLWEYTNVNSFKWISWHIQSCSTYDSTYCSASSSTSISTFRWSYYVDMSWTYYINMRWSYHIDMIGLILYGLHDSTYVNYLVSCYQSFVVILFSWCQNKSYSVPVSVSVPVALPIGVRQFLYCNIHHYNIIIDWCPLCQWESEWVCH